MYSKLARLALGATVALSLLGAANFAQASSLTQTQIDAILNLLVSFGADQATISNVSAALNGQASGGQSSGPTGAGNSCFGLSHNLYVGLNDRSTDGEVSKLQAYLGVSATGYFGPITKQALTNWQSAHGISAIGIVGPATRAALACSGSTSGAPSATIDQSTLTATTEPPSLISASPTVSGTATNTSSVVISITTSLGDTHPIGTIPVKNGHWSTSAIDLINGDVAVPLLAGNYTINVRDGNNNLLTTGTLVVTSQTSALPGTNPILSVTNVSGLIVTIQYANMPAGTSIGVLPSNGTPYNPNLPLSASAIYTQGIGVVGTASFTLPAGTPKGQYDIAALNVQGNVITAKDAGGNTYPISSGTFSIGQ